MDPAPSDASEARDVVVAGGYLVVRTYEALYRRYAPKLDRPLYSIPREGGSPEQMSKRYRGIDREALEGWSLEDLTDPHVIRPVLQESEACLHMHELERRGTVDTDWIFSFDSAREVLGRLPTPTDWEIIWTVQVGAEFQRPRDGTLLGFDPTWFTSDHFSALCDCMCFPRWHGTDEAGTLFLPFHEKLNRHALFETAQAATEFLDFYRSFDWTEDGEYSIAEVWLPR